MAYLLVLCDNNTQWLLTEIELGSGLTGTTYQLCG